MPTVLVTSSSERAARRYVEAVERHSGKARLASPADRSKTAAALLDGVGGLTLTGGADVDPRRYGQAPEPGVELTLEPERDELEFAVLEEALRRDMPVLAICRGMQVLNVAMGGSLLQDIPDHKATRQDGEWVPAYHHIFISPGLRLPSLVGAGGFCRVNSLHHQGFRNAQAAPGLLVSAYNMDDHIVEAVESRDRAWVFGVQCHPERVGEVPKSWEGLFAGLVQRAAEFSEKFSPSS